MIVVRLRLEFTNLIQALSSRSLRLSPSVKSPLLYDFIFENIPFMGALGVDLFAFTISSCLSDKSDEKKVIRCELESANCSLERR